MQEVAIVADVETTFPREVAETFLSICHVCPTPMRNRSIQKII